MKIVFAAGALVLMALVAAPPAEAKDKKSKSTRSLQDVKWGRRSDITMRYWPVHQHPYVRF